MNFQKTIAFFCIPIGLIWLAILLTTGDFALTRKFHLSTIFHNMWTHFLQGDLQIDAELIGQEGFLINGKTTAYFLPFPALIRGLLDLFNLGDAAVLSILIASLIYLYFSILLMNDLLEIRGPQHGLAKLLAPLGSILLVISPPISSLMTYPDVFTEAIIWGYSLFMACIYFSAKAIETNGSAKYLSLLSLCCGLCLFTRAPYLIACSALILLSLIFIIKKRLTNRAVKLVWCASLTRTLFIYAFFLIALGCFNYAKWGDAFEFYPLSHYKMYTAEEFNQLIKSGIIRFNRIPEAISYYLLPTSDNFIPSIPFIKTGLINYFDHFGSPTNYREPAYPILLMMPVYSLLSILGATLVIWNSLKKDASMEASILAPSIIASLFPIGIILCLHANAWRYVGEFIPLITALSIFAWAWLCQQFNFERTISRLQYCLIFLIAVSILIFNLALSAITVFRKDVFLLHWNLNPQYISQPSPIQKNRTIFFDRIAVKKTQLPYLREGWSEPENHFTWSNDKKARIEFPLPAINIPSQIEFKVLALVSPTHPNQEVTIWVDGKFNQTLRLNEWESNVIIKGLASTSHKHNWLEKLINTPLHPEIMRIEFTFHNSISPKELAISDDARQLAIALVSATFK